LAGEDQRVDQDAQLVSAQVLAVGLRCDERGDQVIARVVAALCDQVIASGVEAGDGSVDAVLLGSGGRTAI